MFRDCLRAAKPRVVSLSWDSPFFLFTDACFAPEDHTWPCGLGGVLSIQMVLCFSAFSICLQPTDLLVVGYPAKSTVIFEAELLAVLVSLKFWGERF